MVPKSKQIVPSELMAEAIKLHINLKKEYTQSLYSSTGGDLIHKIEELCGKIGISTFECRVEITEEWFEYDSQSTHFLQFSCEVDKSADELKKDIEKKKKELANTRQYKLQQLANLKKELGE